MMQGARNQTGWASLHLRPLIRVCRRV